MQLDIEKTNYLDIPLIEEYYALTEVLNSHMQIQFNINAKRSLYEDILDRFKPFSDTSEIKKNIDILNNTVFLHQKKIKKIPTSLPENKIEKLNAKGFDLLKLKIPFNTIELKNAYLSTMQKYDSDIGENKKTIKILNDAYLLYRNFLAFENYIQNNGSKAGYFSIGTGEDFYFDTYITLASIYLDVFDFNKASEILKYVLDNMFIDSSVFDYEYGGVSEVIRRDILKLARMCSGTGNHEVVEPMLETIGAQKCNDIKPKYETWPAYNCEKAKEKYLKELKKIISSKEKYKIILMGEIQAKYAFKNGLITEKRYNEAMKRFAKKENIIEISQMTLDTWLKENSFLKLPFDTKLNFASISIDSSVTYPVSTSSKNIYTLTPEQQNEYYATFHKKPTVKSIDKYMDYRLYSYIFSLKEFKHKESYLSQIMDECRLFLKIYEDNPIPQTSKTTYRKIFKLLDYLMKLSSLSTQNNHSEVFKEFTKTIIREENLLFMEAEIDRGDPYKNAPWTKKETHRKPQMSRKEVIDELDEQYIDHKHYEDITELIDGLPNDFNYLGEALCSEKFGKNIELAEEVFNIAAKEVLYDEDADSVLDVIKNIASTNVFNNKEWAKKIYLQKQNDIEEDTDNLVTCAEVITKDEYINDKKWGKEIIQKAIDKVSETELILIADIVASSDGLNDKKWAKDIISLVQKVPDNYLDLILLGEKLAKKDGLNDIETAKNIAIEAAKKCEGAGCLKMIAEYVMKNLNDSALANKITNMLLKEIKMTTVKFTVYGGKDDKTDEYLKNIIEDNTYYELEVRSGVKIQEVLSGIVRNEKFMKDVLYNKWNSILKPEFDIMGELDSVLYINRLIYEGTTFNSDYELSPGWPLHIASRMVFGFKEDTVSSLDY